MAKRSFDYSAKIIIIGDSGVGKVIDIENE
jgi:GTPase SAR1 family protein